MSEQQVWRVGDVSWKEWDNEAVVYSQSSGQTHLINETSTRVLALIRQEPASVLALSQRLAEHNAVELDDELVRHVESLLVNLEAMGLIEPVA